MITCRNCGHRFEGKYCSNCRQAADTHRLTWHELGHMLTHAVIHADKGLLYTIRELTLRPGKTIRDYLSGKRAYHFNPVLFLILVGGFTSLLYISLNVSPLNKEIDLVKIKAYSGTLAYKYFALVGGIFIFLLSVTDYFFYRSKKYLLSEHVASNALQIGQVMVFTIAVLPLLLLQSYVVSKTGMQWESRLPVKLVMVGYLFLVRYQMYDARGNWKMSARILLQLITVYLIYDQVITRIIVKWFGEI